VARGAVLPVAGNGAVNQRRVPCARRVVAQSDSRERAHAEVLDEHVHALDEAQAQFDSLWLFQIDRDAALPTIESEKEARFAVRKWWSPAAAHIAGARLQLVHGGAIIGQQ